MDGTVCIDQSEGGGGGAPGRAQGRPVTTAIRYDLHDPGFPVDPLPNEGGRGPGANGASPTCPPERRLKDNRSSFVPDRCLASV